MKKDELIRKIAVDTDFQIKDVKAVFDSMQRIVMDCIVEGEPVAILKGLTIFTAVRPERNGVNPKTGEKIVVPPRACIKTKIGATLKNLIK